jgi:hypothetical protein
MENNESIELQSNSKQARIEVDLANLPTDHCLRKKNFDYHSSDRDNIRKAYLQKRVCPPFNHNFSQTQFGKTRRCFNSAWFKEYSDWLEYNILKDALYCLFCYLFRPNTRNQAGRDSFVTEGFKNWKKKDKLQNYIGAHNSAHNQARRRC